MRLIHSLVHQVHLATSLGKAVIPALLENVSSWPSPSDSKLGRHLPLQLFADAAADRASSKVFWSAVQFKELLVHISYTVLPDVDSISEGKATCYSSVNICCSRGNWTSVVRAYM